MLDGYDLLSICQHVAAQISMPSIFLCGGECPIPTDGHFLISREYSITPELAQATHRLMSHEIE